ncbi:transient receptor potential channel pyrexia-like [Daktulosphaira vitifoliae]|uniref:transient receptor potential channel pyrexia-like n=1 Tax=Daktulosphaira vitifoliae TaxID=58002 RepID=UPI0021AA4FFF|nr:transient receptor potential channel pyrexia-like [Daktulosphaira vitifoliae]
MSLKASVDRRLSLDQSTREYLEMGMDLTPKKKRYFSFHEKAINRERPVSFKVPDVDLVEEVEEPSGTETTVTSGGRRFSNELSVNNYREMVKQCLLDASKVFTNGFQFLREVENDQADLTVLKRCPQQLKNLILLWTCYLDKCDIVQTLVNADTNIDYVLPFRGYGAVHISALNGCVRCLKRLINAGCSPHARVDDMSSLHFATYTDSVDSVQLLVDSGCRLEPTVLHSAVKARAVNCIKLLVSKYSVDVNVLDSSGFAPIHICADQGFADCMNMLLMSDRILVNIKGYQDNTAMHLACESAQLECVKLLLDHGGNVHDKNAKLQVPMHMAAKAQSVECIEALVRAGADVNARDVDDRTPLHTVIAAKTLNVSQAVEALLGYQAKVNVQDHFGFTPLHVAALNEAPECVDSLLHRGGNVGIHTYGGISALNMIVRKLPSCVPAVGRQLDNAISSNWADGFKRGPEIQLKFKNLLDSNTFGEIDLLKCFQEEGQYELLQHPLCQAFLYLKWDKIRKYYLMRLASLALFITFYTLYVLTVLSRDCYNAAHFSQMNISSCVNNSVVGQFLVTHYHIMDVIAYVLYVIAVVESFLKISEMAGYAYLSEYFLNLSNFSEWLVLVSVPVISFSIFGQTYQWQNHVGAFSVLCAWTNLMVKVGQLPWFDTYVAMYTKVQKEFAKLLMAYMCLLIGFSVSLCVVFPNSPWFNNPITGFVKVLVIMAGELDLNLLEVHNQSPLMTQLSAYIVYVALLVFVSIILMNLLVGIAVSDIQGLKKTAGLSKVRCQIKLIHYIELFMLRSFWPKSIKRKALVYPSKNRAYMTVKPLNQRQALPRDIIDAIRTLVKRKKQDRCENNEQLSIKEILKEVKELRNVVDENQKVIRHLLMNLNSAK